MIKFRIEIDAAIEVNHDNEANHEIVVIDPHHAMAAANVPSQKCGNVPNRKSESVPSQKREKNGNVRRRAHASAAPVANVIKWAHG